jgi:hypothetical protein
MIREEARLATGSIDARRASLGKGLDWSSCAAAVGTGEAFEVVGLSRGEEKYG